MTYQKAKRDQQSELYDEMLTEDEMLAEGEYAPDYRTYTLAKLENRVFAYLIDMVLTGILSAIVAGLFNFESAGWGLGFLVGLAYRWYFLLYQNGQTLGKQWMHIRVIKVDGRPLTGADVILREIGYVINNVLLGLGWLWAGFDPDRQGIQDKLANTYVVTE